MCAFLNGKTSSRILLFDFINFAEIALAKQANLVEALVKPLKLERALLAGAPAATHPKGQV